MRWKRRKIYGKEGLTVFDQVVLGQTQEARCIGESLGQEETDGVAELVLLGGRPAVDVLEQGGEGGFLEGFLKIFVPSDEFVENLDIRLYVFDLCRLLDIEDGEGRDRSAIVDVAAAGLEEAADEDNLEKIGCILEEFEGGACLDELCREGVKVVLWDGFKVFEELVSEYWAEVRWSGGGVGKRVIPAGSCLA